jgi:hypothetical protein
MASKTRGTRRHESKAAAAVRDVPVSTKRGHLYSTSKGTGGANATSWNTNTLLSASHTLKQRLLAVEAMARRADGGGRLDGLLKSLRLDEEEHEEEDEEEDDTTLGNAWEA